MTNKNYTCKATKDEIVTAIIEQFKKVNAEYNQSLNNDEPEFLKERKFGRYIAMIELLQNVKIFEND